MLNKIQPKHKKHKLSKICYLFHFLCLNLMVSKISTIKQLWVFLMYQVDQKCQ
jgi:hypothetical protein